MPLLAEIVGPDLLVVLAIAAVLFGGSRIPGLARSLGQAVHEFRDAVGDSPAADPSPDAHPDPAAGPDAHPPTPAPPTSEATDPPAPSPPAEPSPSRPSDTGADAAGPPRSDGGPAATGP